MQQTTNYSLNQWAPEDRILREDFNADNAKLDAAIKAMADAVPIVKLMDTTTSVAAQQVDLDISGLDLTKYHELNIYYSGPESAATSFYLRLNNLTAGYGTGDSTYLQYMTLDSTNHPGATQLTLLLGRIIFTKSMGGSWNTGTTFGSFSGSGYTKPNVVLPATLHTLNLVCAETTGGMPSGIHITIYGVRK